MLPKLRVCHIGFSFFPGQGLTIFYEFSRHLARQGVDVHVIAPGRPDEAEDEYIDGVQIHRIPLNSVGRYSIGRLKFLWKATRWLNRRQFDLIHVYAFVGASGLRLLSSSKRQTQWLYDCQTSAIKPPALALQNLLIRLESTPYDAITVLSDGIRKIVFGSRNRKIKATIPLGADFSHFMPRKDTAGLRERLGIPENAPVLTYCGTLDHCRHMDRLVKAFSLVANERPDTRLLMIGDGSALVDLRYEATQLGIADRIVFTGFIPYDQIPRYLSISTVALAYIAQTSYFEHQPPTKTVEYLALGLPVVATDTSGNREFVTNGENGLLADDNPLSYANAVLQLLGNDGLRESLASRARTSVEDYDWENIVRKYVIPVYVEVLTGKRSKGH